MRSHVTVLSVLALLFGAACVVFGCSLLGSAASAGMGLMNIGGGVLWLAAGWGLLGQRGWGRTSMIVLVVLLVLAGLSISVQSLGMYGDDQTSMMVAGLTFIAFSIYALYVLLSPRTAALFAKSDDPTAAGALLR